MTPYTTEEVLEGLRRPIDRLFTIDFETYYGGDYTLSKMTTEQYVRDPRFEVILVGVKEGDEPAVYLTPEAFTAWLRSVDWSRTAVLAHHAHFDGLILSHHFGVAPAFWLCTLSMARALHGTEVGNSLAKLSVYYEVGEKGTEVIRAEGKRRADFTAEEYAEYGRYCEKDCDLEKAILNVMLEEGFPEVELWNIDTTVRWFTEPTFVLDEALLCRFLGYERSRKAELLARVGADKGMLSSGEKFAALLQAFGVEPPMKEGKNGPIYAFAKSDPGMQALLMHEIDEVRWLAEARIAIKSTINETRTERLLRAGVGGRPVPVYNKYAGAHTYRWSGADSLNFQNFERVPEEFKKPGDEWKGTIRKALRAPVEAA